MKIQIRKGVFETNSSSVHSLTMCMDDDYKKWEKGELVWDRWDQELIPTPESYDEDDGRYQTMDEFFSNYTFETFNDTFVTPSGEKVHAFGYYGNDY